jgi:hypothetical protein
MRRLLPALLVLASVVGCRPSRAPDIDAGPPPVDAFVGPHGTVTGRVWAPGQAPGTVPAGQEIPVSGALLYVSIQRPEPIPQEAHCQPCIDPPFTSVLSDADGAFALDLAPGRYWLVIQKGQFRREQEVDVVLDETLALPAEATTLPSELDPEGGKWIPRIAMAVGNWDKLEDILGKMGLGEVSATGRFAGTLGRIDLYGNGGQDPGLEAAGTLGELMGSLETMLAYHIIFIPCSGDAHTALLQDPATLQNLRDYVAAGGKLYVTDWSGEWNDNVFPAQIELGPSELGQGAIDTPASAYDPVAGTWDPAAFGSADGDSYDSNNAEAADEDLAAWLDGQMGPNAEGDLEVYDADDFDIVDNWNYITSLDDVTIGEDDEGIPVIDAPKAWVVGGQGTALPKRPLTVTHEPAGCGRVLFSTYHTTPSTHLGLVPQERVLLYLIMEIGVCKTGPIIE